jgi:FkbM family methyltransferase
MTVINREEFEYKTFSQCGEDRIAMHALTTVLGKQWDTHYLDIGAHHPFEYNNTALFHICDEIGICVEPHPYYFKLLKKCRQPSIVMQRAVTGSSTDEMVDFYISSTPTLHSLSPRLIIASEARGVKVKKVIKIKTISINDLFKLATKKEMFPDFVTIDTEGTEIDIVSHIDFDAFRPALYCIETLCYPVDLTNRKDEIAITDIMQKNDYSAWGKTFINTMFIDNIKLRERFKS